MLGAGAALTTLAAAPALTRATPPLRTVYIAKSVRSLPQTAFVRTRDCVRRPRSCVNGARGLELVYLNRGKMPARSTSADTRCAADRKGISHCLNILRLASGRRITVRHDHSMMNDPCLAPSERVRVRPLR